MIKFYEVVNTPSMPEVAELLETTADRFESGQYQWYQGGLEDDEGRMCAVGAVRYTSHQKVSDSSPLSDNAIALLKNALIRRGYNQFLGDWNDEPDRTLSEVIDLMKDAAKDLRNSADGS